MKIKFAKEFLDFTYESGSTYHAVRLATKMLEKEGFIRLNHKEKWKVEKGGKYFVKRTNSTFIAFIVGNEIDDNTAFRLVATHTDSPCFKIKPNPEMNSEGYLRINTEVYGGPILNTWFDRPLSIAGRVIVKSDNVFAPRTINIKINEPILTIPNVAIHQNRTVNEGMNIDKQNDVLPVLTLINNEFEKDNYLMKVLVEKSEDIKKENIKIEDILDFDLFLYNYEKGTLIGANQELISAPRIDNLASVFSGVHALLESDNHNHNINVLVGFDNEEVGSSTRQGADSNYLANVLERIYYALGQNRNDFLEATYRSFLISADGAHAVHPAHAEKTDPVVKPHINEGVVLKISAAQKYTSDGYSISVIKQIVKDKLKLQYFVNNSKFRGGSTIGPLSSTHFDADSVDLGVPMLAMHSVRELCGVDDLFDMKELFKLFYSEK